LQLSPLISIVIVTKNQVELLVRAVNSIQSQTFKSYQLVIVDGASSDGTVKYLKQLNAVTWISEVDCGPYNAMNKALRLCIGKYVYFLGSDDYLLGPRILSTASTFLDEYKSKSVLLNFKVLLVNGSFYPASPLTEYDLRRGSKLCHQGVMFPLCKLLQLKGFDERFKIASDQDLILRGLLAGLRLVNVNKSIAFYSPGGISSRRSLFETAMILFKNKLYTRALQFAVVEYARRFLIACLIIRRTF